MSRLPKKLLDGVDEQMLALLAANARTPLVTLAKKVGLSRSAAQERLKRLETHGVIAGYTVTRGADTQAHRAWLLLRYQPGTLCANIVPLIRKMPAVRLCHSLAGAIDMMLLVEAESPAQLTAVRAQAAALPGIAEVTTAPVMKAHFG